VLSGELEIVNETAEKDGPTQHEGKSEGTQHEAAKRKCVAGFKTRWGLQVVLPTLHVHQTASCRNKAEEEETGKEEEQEEEDSEEKEEKEEEKTQESFQTRVETANMSKGEMRTKEVAKGGGGGEGVGAAKYSALWEKKLADLIVFRTLHGHCCISKSDVDKVQCAGSFMYSYC